MTLELDQREKQLLFDTDVFIADDLRRTERRSNEKPRLSEVVIHLLLSRNGDPALAAKLCDALTDADYQQLIQRLCDGKPR